MKRIIKIIMVLCAIIVFCNGMKFVAFKLQDKAIADLIEADKYTIQEYNDFQNGLLDKTFYYYNNLDDELKDSYITLYFSALDFDETCKVELTEEELEQVVEAVMYDNSNLFWLTGSYTYYTYEDYIEVAHEYRYNENEARDISKRLEKKIDDIISGMPNYSTDFEKELYLHDYVCDNTVYDETTLEGEGQSAHGALLNGRTVCEGYARAIQLLLDEVDIDNYLIVGNASANNSEELHMWNVVEIDGYNYHLDSTWNDGAFTDAQGYFYFNVTDAYIMRTHSNFNVQNNYCSYNYANYFNMMDTYIEIFTGFSGLVDATAGVLSTGENTVEYVFENSGDYKRAVAEIDNDSKFFDFVEKSVVRSGRRLSKTSVSYGTVDRYYYLSITFKED